MADLDIEIDGKTYPARPGENLLQTCLGLGLDLPYFCWHPALGSVGACRQCAVIQYQNPEDTRGRLVMACMTPVSPGMRVSLKHPDAQAFRADVIELLMTNHPHDCPVCEEGGECHLQDMTVMTGHTARRYRGKKRTHQNQDLGPFVKHEMNRCIACYRCVRYYRDYCGGADLQAFASHNHVYFGRAEDGALENEFSGNLVEVCPTGVFTDKTFSRHYTRKWDLQTAPSVCVHCAVGCNTSPGERYGSLRRIANRYHGEVNGYFLCDRGRFGYESVNAPERIHQPELRDQPPLVPGGAGRLFARICQQAKGLIGIGSPRASLEANFALRELVGAERFHAGFADEEYALLKTVLEILRHSPVRSVPLRSVEQADAVLVLGEDVTQTAPRLALALRQATRQRALRLADRLKIPRWQDAAVRTATSAAQSPLFIATCAPTRLDDVAEQTLRASPEEIARLGFAVAHHLNGEAPEVSGLSPKLDALAWVFAQALQAAERPLVVSGTGCQSKAVIHAAAQVAWALASRREGKPTDAHFVVPECNSLGAAMMGGKTLGEAFMRLEQGEADTVVVLENDLYRRAERQRVDGFLRKAKQVVVIDHLFHGTARQAGLVLPSGSFAETEGTLVNSEGRAQRFFSVFVPAGGIRDGWRWLRDADQKSCANMDEVTSRCAASLPVFNRIWQAAPDAGFRIEGRKIPRQTQRHSGRTAMLAQTTIHEPQQPADPDSALAFSMEGATAGPPAALNPFVWAPGWNSNQSVNQFQETIGGAMRGGDPGVRLIEPASDSGFTWITPIPPPQSSRFKLVPLHHIFGSEELSQHAPALAGRAPEAYLALCPEDAAELGLAAGALVHAGFAEARLPVLILPGLARGLAGVPVGLPGLAWVDVAAGHWECQADDERSSSP